MFLGRSLPCPPSGELHSRQLARLGSEDHNSSRLVCLHCQQYEIILTDVDERYFISYLHLKILQALHILSLEISAKDFRSVNAIAVIPSLWIVHRLQTLSSSDRVDDRDAGGDEKLVSPSTSLHSTVNICLFPPLFFFCGLYYTDVLSALSVLFTYKCFLERKSDISIVVAGLVSLSFRQTNNFWVGVLLGGLAFCSSARKDREWERSSEQPSFHDVIRKTYLHGSVYDPDLSRASFAG